VIPYTIGLQNYKKYFMIKKIVIFLNFLTIIINGFAQASDSLKISKNTIYVEILGSAGYLYNVSFDRIFYKQNRHKISGGLGVQYYEGDLSYRTLQTASPQLNYLLGLDRHFLEFGVGYIWNFLNTYENSIIMRFGYRYQRFKGLFFKIGITPFLTKSYRIFGVGYKIIPWGGIALGYSF